MTVRSLWLVPLLSIALLLGFSPPSGAATQGAITITAASTTVPPGDEGPYLTWSGNADAPLVVSLMSGDSVVDTYILYQGGGTQQWWLADVADGDYTIVARAADNTVLTTDLVVGPLTVARRLPVINTPTMSQRVYPAKDGYKDSLVIRSDVDWAVGTYVANIYSGSTLVRTLPMTRSYRHLSATWTGRWGASFKGIWKAGHYKVVIVGTTPNGTATSPSGWATVANGRLTKKHFSGSYTAKSVVDGSYVGTCSALFWINSGAWKYAESMRSNYYSGCPASAESDYVGIYYRLGLKKAVKYGAATVTTRGAGWQKSDWGRLSFLTHHKDNFYFQGHTKMGSADGVHSLRWGALSPYQGKLWWHTDTWGGSWYDVKWFKVAYDYWVIQ